MEVYSDSRTLRSSPESGARAGYDGAKRNDGSITLVDLNKDEAVDSIDTLKDQRFAPDSIVLLPEWNDMAGH